MIEDKINISIDDLYKIHNKEIFKDRYLIFLFSTKNKITDVQKLLLHKHELQELYEKIGEELKK